MLLSGIYGRYGLYSSPEFICPEAIETLVWNFERPYRPSWLQHYVDKWNLGPTKYAVIFSGNDADHLDGLFKFSFQEKTKTLITKGTLVNPTYRKRGVAKQMWALAIDELKPNKIIAFASTRDGLRFINKMKKKYPNIIWKIEETL